MSRYDDEERMVAVDSRFVAPKPADSMLESAVSTLRTDERPVTGSDRGGRYRWPEWIRICEEHGLVRSIPKKGCSPDNSACEELFDRMKVEMFYGGCWAGWTTSDFMDEIVEYTR